MSGSEPLRKSMKKLLMTLSAAAMLIFCAATSNAQSITIKEKLPNGELILLVDGVEQRTITADHAREITQRKIDLEAMTAERDLLKQKATNLQAVIDLMTRRSELDVHELALVRAERDSYKSLFEGEKDLRLKAEKLGGGKTTGF